MRRRALLLALAWAIYHPYQNIDGFVATHPGWAGIDDILLRHRPAAEDFLVWCRRHPAEGGAQPCEGAHHRPAGGRSGRLGPDGAARSRSPQQRYQAR